MEKKAIGIFVCLLVIAVAFLAVAGTESLRKVDISSTSHLSARDAGQTKDVNPPAIIDFKAGDTLFYQRPYEPTEGWAFYTSTDDPDYPIFYRCYENFWDLAGPICDIHWWGLSLTYPWANCDPAGMEFEIIFYSDDPHDTTNMPPTDVVCTYSNVLPSYTYYNDYAGYNCYFFSVDLDPCCDLRNGWVSIQSTYSPNSCWFLWSASPQGDSFAYQEGTGPLAVDLALILTGEPEEPWPNHKMHFPQEPDLIGWDVNATYPKILADDWQCSQTGWVTDIHFWGSWKNIDGDPYTDDYYTPMPWFNLSIHRNIPADSDTPWSRPGEELWRWEGEIPGTPSEPPTLEAWYDPNLDSTICNDHVPYWRYDFIVAEAYPPVDSFYQYKDSIYWLNVSALNIPLPYQWGWKNSRDHFMDDAVYRDDIPPIPPWMPIIEPPRCNWFDVYFDSAGIPEDWGSTNYYGSGWYRYEYWWNMWFYDNPFVYQPKHIWLEFWIEEVGPQAYAEFAINWSTDLWSLEGVPDRPPLPGDDETLYIGRQTFTVQPGPNTIDFWIDDYNPEWVSIDFVATDVIINGWIWHECDSTSLDLAFVITGHDGVPEESLYWKPSYEDYAPSGMPDIDQKQDGWFKQTTGEWSFCGPVAVANCFKWFDAKYNQHNPGTPCDCADEFPLVRDYTDNLPAIWCAVPWDDHSPENMDHPGTPWLFGATGPPPATPQPFVPGAQPCPGTMSPWGELVERLAWYFDTDGVRYGYCSHSGTDVYEMQDGIQEWLESEQFQDGSTLADTLCEKTWPKPTFAKVESLVEKCEDVILLLGFWFEDPPGSGAWFRCGGHYVTVAGVNSDSFLIAISDPYYDNAEAGGRGRVGNGTIISHTPPHTDATVHNDEGNVSHDIYTVTTQAISPGGVWELVDYPVSVNPYDCERFHLQNVPAEFEAVSMYWNGQSPIFTEVEYCVQISPWDYRGDVNLPGGDGMINSADVVFILNYLFVGGPAPTPFSDGDVNCDGIINSADVVFLLNYLFVGGPVPRCCDP